MSSEAVNIDNWRPPANIADLDPREWGEVMNQLAKENDIIKQAQGLRFRNDAQFVEFVDGLTDLTGGAAKVLLRAAVDRLRRDGADPDFEIGEISQVKLSFPCQWEGRLIDGQDFFIRYKYKTLKAWIDDDLVACIDLEDAPDTENHRIPYDRMSTLLANTFVFPEEAKVIPAKV